MMHFVKHGQIEGTNIDSGKPWIKHRFWKLVVGDDPSNARPPGGDIGLNTISAEDWPYYQKLVGIIRQSLGEDAPTFDESFASGLLDALENGPFDDGITVRLDGTWITDTERDEENNRDY